MNKKRQKQVQVSEITYDAVTATLRRMVRGINRRGGNLNSVVTQTTDQAMWFHAKLLEEHGLTQALQERGVRPLVEIERHGWRDGDEEREFVIACNQPLKRMMIDRYRARNTEARGGWVGQSDLTPEQLESAHWIDGLPEADRKTAAEFMTHLIEAHERERGGKEAQVVQLSFFQGRSNADIGGLLGITAERVRQLRVAALGWMRERAKRLLGD